MSSLTPSRAGPGWLLGLVLACSCVFGAWLVVSPPKGVVSHKMLVLGIDGMDPQLLDRYMAEGRMPNFSGLARSGTYKRLRTTTPPQSPVAWSTLITGMNPGGHGIFDFIHRDPKSLQPYLSTARTEPPKYTIRLGGWTLPLSSGKVVLLREGQSFWQVLDQHDIPATVIRIPANFPPVSTDSRTLAGMGTPDIQGTYGTFSFFTNDPFVEPGPVNGGYVYRVDPKPGKITTKLPGPPNSFRRGDPPSSTGLTVWIDAQQPVVRMDLGNRQIVLREGEWSNWVPVPFTLLPHLESVSGICRFYLKQVRPIFKLYASPVNLDPASPALPLSTPNNYSAELFRQAGYYYTQGIPEDTKALSSGVLDANEFRQQAQMVFDEEKKLFNVELAEFKTGLLFYYFSILDQAGHMFWRAADPNAPNGREAHLTVEDPLRDFYTQIDQVLGAALSKVDRDTTLLVLSDHGFAPYYRSFNLNRWLQEKGYLATRSDAGPKTEFPANVDWHETRAYGLGLNGLYVNLAGRESQGTVAQGSEADQLMDKIAAALLAERDGSTAVITRIDKGSAIYGTKFANRAPDLVIGYNRGYRAGWSTVLGGVEGAAIEDNDAAWSGDHCIDPSLVPGILMTNRAVTLDSPGLADIAPTVLGDFGIAKTSGMQGEPLWRAH